MDNVSIPAVLYHHRVKFLETSIRVSNALTNENIVTLEELERLSNNMLLRLPNFGRKSLEELELAVKHYIHSPEMHDPQPMTFLDIKTEQRLEKAIEAFSTFIEILNAEFKHLEYLVSTIRKK